MTINVSFLIMSRVDYCELLCLVNWTQCFDQTLINLTSGEKKIYQNKTNLSPDYKMGANMHLDLCIQCLKFHFTMSILI